MNTTAFSYQVAAVLRELFRGFHLGNKLGKLPGTARADAAAQAGGAFAASTKRFAVPHPLG